MPALIVAFLVALALSLALTPPVRDRAARVGLVARPGGRHAHERPTPNVGGIAVYLSATAVLAGAPLLGAPGPGPNDVRLAQLAALLVGGGAIFLLGLWDDTCGLSARRKFVLEALVAAGVFAAGIRIESVGLPDGGVFTFPLWASAPLTVLWIVGITNAFNLVDGSDGVAGGAALFASVVLALVSLSSGQVLGALVALALAGAVLGFLRYNFPPASVFMGDCGSLFLGFSLASLGLTTTQKASTALAVLVPVLSFGLPILDTGLAVTRRFLRRRPLFEPDRGHIHHRLRDLGHSPRHVVLLLYGACAAFAVLSLLLVRQGGSATGVVFLIAGVGAAASIQRLKIPELVELRRIVDRGLRQRRVIAHNVRVRQAIWRLGAAGTPDDVLGAVRHAFEDGEFERVEFWLPARLAAPLAAAEDGFERDGVGYRWAWRPHRGGEHGDGPAGGVSDGSDGTNGSGSAARGWEIALPFVGPDGGSIGRLSLVHPAVSGQLLTDVSVIGGELMPALLRALDRMESAEGVEREEAVEGAESVQAVEGSESVERAEEAERTDVDGDVDADGGGVARAA